MSHFNCEKNMPITDPEKKQIAQKATTSYEDLLHMCGARNPFSPQQDAENAIIVISALEKQNSWYQERHKITILKF